jgi:hypothetical protein
MYEPQNTDEHLEKLNKVMMEWHRKGHFDNIPNEMYLLKVIADIRQKTRIGDKVMLADLADTLAGLIQNGESAIETNKQLVKRLQQMKGG